MPTMMPVPSSGGRESDITPPPLVQRRAEKLPLTFRAAGTSLSGQSNSDGVLAVLGDGFRQMRVLDKGDRIFLGPACRLRRDHQRRADRGGKNVSPAINRLPGNDRQKAQSSAQGGTEVAARLQAPLNR